MNNRLYYKACLIALLFSAGLIIAGIIFPALNLINSPGQTKSKRDALKLLWLRWFSKTLNLKITLTGTPSISGCLMVSNHISWLDIIVLGCFSPAHFVAKSDITSWPVIGYLAKQGGTVFVKRGDKQQAKAITEALIWLLKQNRTIVAFPEGTTTKGDTVLPFHTSLFQSAILTKKPVQAITIQYKGAAKELAPFIGDDSFLPHLFTILSLKEVEVKIDFLPVITPTGKTRQIISNEARALILSGVTGENLNTANSRSN